ncbi:hypothetical protein V5799_017079 [Amblyomma americanum]|uniref:Protein SHQ1 homolog n=1 Tax=Amblyomma americanum TaxID=6943 RepID=A0AAQ4F446_AMBAM
MRCCFRRCLIFPLYRHWGLAYAVLRDVIQILRLGPRYVLRCLLEIHDAFSHHDSRYILNDLYITDYAVWIQSVRPKPLHRLADALKQVKVRKADVDLDIPELERGAKLAIAEAAAEEASSADNVSVALQALCISNPLASAASREGDDAPSSCDAVVEPERELSDDDSTSSEEDSSSWSGDESGSGSSTDTTSDDSSSDSALDSDDDDIPAAAAAKRRSGAVVDGDNVSVTSSSDSDSDDSDGGSSSEADGGIDQCLLFVKDAEHEKRR